MLQGFCEPLSSGSHAWKGIPPTRILIRKEDAASLTRFRTPQGPPVKAQEARIGSLVPSAPQPKPDDKGVGGHLRDHGHVKGKCGSDTNDPRAATKRYSGGQGPAALDCTGGPHYFFFFPAGSNDEIKVVLVYNYQWTRSEEGDSEDIVPPGPPLELNMYSTTVLSLVLRLIFFKR